MGQRLETPVDMESVAAVEEAKEHIQKRWLELCGAHADLLGAVATYAQADGPRIDQIPNVAAALVLILGCSGHTARALAAEAGIIEAPGIADLLTSGEVTPDHLTTLARRGVTDERIEQARAMDADDLALALRRDTKPADGDERSARERRRCSLRDLPDGDVVGSFRLPATEGEIIRTALERRAGQLPVNPDTGTYDPLSKQLADALTEVCSAAIAGDADPDRATITITTGPQLTYGHLIDGTIIGPEVLHRLLCDCRLEAELISGPGEPLRFSTVHRSPHPAQRRALKRRQHGSCAWPGCHRTHFLDAHHLVHWTSGGPTVLDNLVLICRYHHHVVHEGGWSLTGTPDRLVVHKPDGTRWLPPWRSLIDND